MKLRSLTLPRINGKDEWLIRNSFTKIGVQLSKNLIPNQDIVENLKKYQQQHEFKEKVSKEDLQVQIKVNENLYYKYISR
ncbi:unnamed protein product [Paramecium sonneborni]|uniref:Uncharacterized protein n=1 Tax=Paramecium sonneborni TaxID=65129 RepID=A0A8S1Q008_9CILI|nr:unnamed protein product [Paramecium sonneborni]